MSTLQQKRLPEKLSEAALITSLELAPKAEFSAIRMDHGAKNFAAFEGTVRKCALMASTSHTSHGEDIHKIAQRGLNT